MLQRVRCERTDKQWAAAAADRQALFLAVWLTVSHTLTACTPGLSIHRCLQLQLLMLLQ